MQTVTDDLLYNAKHNPEAAAQVWKIVRGFCWRIIERYRYAAQLNGAADEDDLMQLAALACLETVQNYSFESNYSFIQTLGFAIRHECGKALGLRGRRRDEFFTALSLDVPVGDAKSGLELLDAIEGNIGKDPEQNALNNELCCNVRAAVNDLPKEQRENIVRRYYLRQPADKREIKKAFHILRRDSRIKIYEPDYYRGTGLKAFKYYGMSAVEYIAIQREKMQARALMC